MVQPTNDDRLSGTSSHLISFNASSFLKTSSLWTSSVMFATVVSFPRQTKWSPKQQQTTKPSKCCKWKINIPMRCWTSVAVVARTMTTGCWSFVYLLLSGVLSVCDRGVRPSSTAVYTLLWYASSNHVKNYCSTWLRTKRTPI